MHTWKLKKGAERRFRGGHPWVFSNELAGSPKGIEPGEPVALQDARGRFLARGYGNPATLIAFRALSRDPAEAEPWSPDGVHRRLRDAATLRRRLGLGPYSHRLAFGEADDLPGLVVERYRLADEAPRQVFVLQPHTAGAEALLPAAVAGLEELVAAEHAADAALPAWADSGVVVRRDARMRRLEGLPLDEAVVERPVAEAALGDVAVRMAPGVAGADEGGTAFHTDLLGGQKTGFFLDQAANVQAAARLLASSLAEGSGDDTPLRILDLYGYVGQWGTQLARVAMDAGRPVHVTTVDSSAPALAFAERNVTATGADCEAVRADLPEALGELPAGGYDVVVADPPGFIRGRRDVHTGRAAYLKLNTAAMRRLRPGGLYITCSCSALLGEEDFLTALSKAARRNELTMHWIHRGGQAPDHPVLSAFPEGRYLKCWIGVRAA